MSDNIIHLIEKFEEEKNYWLEKLSGLTEAGAFPTDFPPSPESKPEFLTIPFDDSLAPGVIRISKNNDLSLYVILLTVLKVLMSTYSRRDDIVVASPMHVKDEEDYNDFVLFRDHVDNELSFLELLMQVKKTVSGGYKRQHYPLGKIMESLGLELEQGAFTAVVMMLEGIHKTALKGGKIPFPAGGLLISIAKENEKLELVAGYDANTFSEESVKLLFKNYMNALKWILGNIKAKLSGMELLTGDESQKILNRFNPGAVDFPADTPVQVLFEKAAARNPENAAVIFEDRRVTYRQLNEKANRLAALLKKKGVIPGEVVGILFEGSIEMIVALWGVLKTGCGYLPIDPAYPEDRIGYMLNDCSVRFVVTVKTLSPLLSAGTAASGREIFCIDDLPLETMDGDNPPPTAGGSGLAYVIYTSGTTGNPKGVMVEHRGLVNYALWRINAFEYTPDDVALQPLSYVFDGFMSNFFTAMLAGGPVVMVPDGKKTDMDYIRKTIKEHRVTNISLVPSQYEAIAAEATEEHMESLRFILLAGEKARPQLIEKSKALNPRLRHFIEYGPTEATVTAAGNLDIGPHQTSMVGTPIHNARIYICDDSFKLLPVGIPGEILIGGTGVARGYLNNPELTATKFLPDPYSPGNMLYRTGDLARWTEDGVIQFLGRVDLQVKVGGIRVEPGEIENCLQAFEFVREAAVLEGTNLNGEKYLYACLTCTEGFSEADLKNYLSGRLPHYMLPSYFVYLEELPKTQGGKLDKKALHQLSQKMEKDTGYSGARNTVEERLVQVWEEVLGHHPIGIEDNFFVLGGDSIKTIQIAAKMSAFGYKLGMKEVFENPSIAQLSPLVEELEQRAVQTAVTGDVPLTPVQRYFFEGPDLERGHFNQSVMLFSPDGFDEKTVKVVFSSIMDHHDALRMIYTAGEAGKINQVNRGTGVPLSLEVFDYTAMEPPEALPLLEEKAGEIQAGISLSSGPLMKLGLFRLQDGDRLLIALHHLVVDAVSWRILFEDIDSLLHQYREQGSEEKLILPLKTDSYKQWAEELYTYARSGRLLKEKDYWKNLEKEDIPQPETDFDAENNLVKDCGTLSFRLSEEETRRLLSGVHTAFGTEINDILLTALGLGVKQAFGLQRAAVTLEGHGREEIFDHVDIKRTVGWFTSFYPVVLDCSVQSGTGRQIKEIKETLHRVPQKGIGYGILKYLTPPEQTGDLSFMLKPAIAFNYLGQMDMDLSGLSFTVSGEPAGDTVGPNRERDYLLDVGGMVLENRLEMSVVYNKNHFKAETVRGFLDAFRDKLRELIHFCLEQEVTETTPSDFGYKEFTLDEFDELRRGIEHRETMIYKENIKDIYPLSSMQEGMFFHAMLDNTSRLYFLQTAYRAHEEMDIGAVEKSLNQLVERHDILRTAFVQPDRHRPLQVVLKKRAVAFHYEDISARDDIDAYLTRYKEEDISHLFDLGKDLLIRVAVFKLAPREYCFVWSFHHILMDGWCIGILIAEHLESYKAFIENRSFVLPEPKPYGTFIQWLEKQDRDVSRQYWKELLGGYKTMSGIPSLKALKSREQGYKIEMTRYPLGTERSRRIETFAAGMQVTVSSLFQAAWAVVLGAFNDKRDVVFGAVVSGRPPQIDGVETILGSFMTTIPVRIRFSPDMPFSALAKQAQEEALESEPHHHYSLAEIQAQTPLKQNLFDHIFVFENYPGMDEMSKLSDIESFEQSNYALNIIIIPGEEFNLVFTYNGNLFETGFISKMAGNIEEVLEAVLVDPEVLIGDIAISSHFVATTSKKDDGGDFDL